jgi:hypothetical protein
MKRISKATKCLSISFVLAISYAPSVSGGTQTELPWQVKMSLQLRFPEGASAKLNVALEYPSKEEHSITQVGYNAHRVNDAWEERYEFIVSPKAAPRTPPSHVIVHLSALGFKEQTRNTGILSYTKEGGLKSALALLKVEFAPYNLPSIRNVVRTSEKMPQGNTVFEINLFNALDTEVSITRMSVIQQWLGELGPGAEVYDIKFRRKDEKITAVVEEQGVGRSVSYPVEWQFKEEDFSHSLFSASVPANLRVPVKASAIIRFHISDTDLGTPPRGTNKPGKVKSFDFRLQRRSNRHYQKSISRFEWTFQFEINGELWISSDRKRR